MSEVRITIGGRDYTVACGAGEEDHVSGLGAMINEKLSQLGGSLSPSETQNLLFGALFVADDLHETRKSVSAERLALQDQIEALQGKERDASSAIIERDQLKLRVSQLETELAETQTAQGQSADESDRLRAEAEQHRAAAEAAATNQSALEQKISDLTRERNGLLSKIDNKNELLERANNQMRETNQKLESALAVASPAVSGTLGVDEAELAPSLERFADLLEDCANKLEKQTDNS